MAIKSRSLFAITLLVCFIFWGCPAPDPYKKLPVPYYMAELINGCAIACIQMWAHYDGNILVTQNQINASIPTPTSPADVERGVTEFTFHTGYFYGGDASSNLWQDYCLSASVNSFTAGNPTIIPVLGGQHAVVATGYQYHWDDSAEPVADYIYFHDPNPWGGDKHIKMSACEFKEYWFTPIQGGYFVILGDPIYAANAPASLGAFIEAGGTYYGGPSDYDPFVFEQ